MLSLAMLGPVLGMMGCGSGSGSGGATAGSIVIADASGGTAKVTSLTVATALKLSMMPSGDRINAGVDWTVSCSGDPVTGSVANGSCGTFSPVHTANGAATTFTAPAVVPIGTTVTIVSSVTSNPSQNSSLTFTIVALPITISFGNGGLPPSLVINGTIHPVVRVTNDVADAGVIWAAHCGASACGSFNPTVTGSQAATTYIAPPAVPLGATVTITATSLTDTTKFVSATVTITLPPTAATTGVSITPATFYTQTTGSARSARITAVVANDPAAAGVDWTLGCQAASCGHITAHTASGASASFTGPDAVPPGGTVTITGTSTAYPASSAISTATVITTAPIIVTIAAGSTLPAALMAGSPATLAATVAHDTSKLGVDWSVTCGSAGACGSFNLSPAHTASGSQIVYIAPAALPAGGVVTITAAATAATAGATTIPSNPAFATATITALSPAISLLEMPPAALTSLAQAPVSAVVVNDVAPGGVTWSVQCGSGVPGGCGYILPQETPSGGTAIYTAPPVTAGGSSVTIVATSSANPQVTASSLPVTIDPATSLSIGFVPVAPSQVQAGATVDLSAAVVNDTTAAGVDWQVCASGCGFFTTRAAVAEVPATATTPYVPAVPAVMATTVTGWANNVPLAYTAPQAAPASGSVVILVAAHASPAIADSAMVAITSSTNAAGLRGVVRAGTQPVAGASVALYAAGTTGYSSAATQIYAPGGASAAVTDDSGNFTFAAGYSCPRADSQMYLVALGGHVGANAANPNLSLMTALGSCGTLSSASVVVNEVTTVASAYATAPFAANEALTGNSSYLYLGTSSSNVIGLANAFAATNNLVDIATGQARSAVPAGNAAVPYVQINTLADVLNACTASGGGLYGDGSACGSVFTYAAVLDPNTQPTSFAAFAPADTLQAMFNIAQHPVTGYGYKLQSGNSPIGLVTGASPFQPTLPALPNDLSLSLNYTGGGGLSAASIVGSLAIDAAGNVWITDTKAGSVAAWNALGAALSPPTGFPAGGGPLAIDATGNVWISGDGSLTELNGAGLPVLGSPFGGVAGGGSDLAIDAQSNLWIAAGGGVAEFNPLGGAVSPKAGYVNDGIMGITAVGVDSANNIWLDYTPSATSFFAELTNPGGQTSTTTSELGTSAFPELAADGAGDIWAVGTSVCKLAPYGGRGTSVIPTCYAGGGIGNLAYVNARGIALDGAGVVWVANPGGGAGSSILPSIVPINPKLVFDTGPFLVSPSLGAGTVWLAVDGSGNIWVLLADGTVTEYVGAATPVVTPLALGVKNKKLASRP